MPITDNTGNKVTPKNKAKMILQDYFNEFDLNNYSDGMKPGFLINSEIRPSFVVRNAWEAKTKKRRIRMRIKSIFTPARKKTPAVRGGQK